MKLAPVSARHCTIWRSKSVGKHCNFPGKYNQAKPVTLEVSMGKHKGKGKEATPRHKLSKSTRFEAAWGGTGNVDGFQNDPRGKFCFI